jgi:cholesterol transport system auxiliary component
MSAAPRLLALALGVSLGSGCSLMAPAQVDVRKEVLSKLPLDLPQQKTRAATVLVLAPETNPLYDTTRMAYTVRPYEIDFFGRHEWGEAPSQMLQPLLVQALLATHAFSAVRVPPHVGRISYSLRTEILELVQDFTSPQPMLHLALRVQLNDDATSRVVATRELRLREPMQQKTPYAGVVAANEATAKALQEVVRFMLEKAL